MNIINLLKANNLKRFDEQKNYTGYVLTLAKMFGAKKLGFRLEIMDPKTFSAPYHYHEQEEELFIILEGEAIVRRNNEFRKVGPGDVIFYEVGPQSAHNMYNHTDKPLRLIGISNATDNDICHYPDSGKRTSEKGILQNDVVVNYFKDEEDPSKYWPEHALRGEV